MKAFRTVCIVIAIAVAMTAVYENRHALYRVLHSYKLVPIEEGITELYFENADALPQRAGFLTFSFVIRNLEGKDMVYPYAIYIESNGEREEVGRDTAAVPTGGSISVPTSLRVQGGNPSRVVVELLDQGQHIAFQIH